MATLRTSRLILTPFTLAETEELFSIRGDTQAMVHWDWPGDETVAQSRAAAQLHVGDVQRGVALYWTARMVDEHSFVGVFDLSELTAESADLGFMIRRQLWGRGYASEGAQAVVTHARDLGLRTLRARIHADNERSAALLRRLGFYEQRDRAATIEIRPGVRKYCRFFALPLEEAVRASRFRG